MSVRKLGVAAMMGMRARFGLGIARDLKQHMNKLFMRYESSCSEKRLYLYFEEIYGPPRGAYQSYTLKKFPVRCVNLSYLLSPSPPSPPPSSSTNKFVQAPKLATGFRPRSPVLLSPPGAGGSRSYAATKSPWSNITDEFVPALRERRGASVKRTKWAGCFTSGPFLFGGSQSQAALERSCSLKSKTKVKKNNNNYPVVKLLKKDGFEFLFLDGEFPADHGELYSLIYNRYDASNRNLLQVLFDTNDNSKSKWVPLGGPPGIADYGSHPGTFSSLVCNNKLLLFWYPNSQGAYCFDVTQQEQGWSLAPPSWGRSIPFLDCVWSLLVELHDHDHLLLFTYGRDYARTHRSIQVFLMSRQCDTFQSLNRTLQLPEVPDVPSDFWNLDDPDLPWGCLEHQFVNLGGSKICLVLHRFFYHCDTHTTLPGTDKGKGYIVLITFEYEINIQSLDIEYRLLTVRNLEYTGKQDKRKPAACIRSTGLAGAVVL